MLRKFQNIMLMLKRRKVGLSPFCSHFAAIVTEFSCPSDFAAFYPKSPDQERATGPAQPGAAEWTKRSDSALRSAARSKVSFHMFSAVIAPGRARRRPHTTL